jgi:hypothetical protein
MVPGPLLGPSSPVSKSERARLVPEPARYMTAGWDDLNMPRVKAALAWREGQRYRDNREGMTTRTHAKTRGERNVQQLSKFAAWRAETLRGL